MANQASKWLYQLMANSHERAEEPTEQDLGMEPPARDDDIVRLRIRKRRQTHMLRQMLEQGGYGDLAKQTNISGSRPVFTSDGTEGEY